MFESIAFSFYLRIYSIKVYHFLNKYPFQARLKCNFSEALRNQITEKVLDPVDTHF